MWRFYVNMVQNELGERIGYNDSPVSFFVNIFTIGICLVYLLINFKPRPLFIIVQAILCFLMNYAILILLVLHLKDGLDEIRSDVRLNHVSHYNLSDKAVPLTPIIICNFGLVLLFFYWKKNFLQKQTSP